MFWSREYVGNLYLPLSCVVNLKLIQKKEKTHTQWRGSCFGWDKTARNLALHLGVVICFLSQGPLSDHRPCVLITK